MVCVGAATGCLGRTRVDRSVSTPKATATVEELTEKLEVFGDIRTMKSTVELRLAVVTNEQSSKKRRTKSNRKIQRVQEFTEVRGFILIERPASIRTIAEVPVVKSKAFDMVSDGIEFKVYIPPTNRFLIGPEAIAESPKDRIDRVRPQHLLEAVLIDPPRQNEPYRMLENVLHRKRAYQIVHLMGKDENGKVRLLRKIWFDRSDLEISRIQIFDDLADLVTDVSYTEWSMAKELPYPQTIFLTRPKDGYEVQVRILNPGLNESLSKRSFELEAPAGTKIERIGEKMKVHPEGTT
ncbi:MAG: hypothetical protein CMN58_00450 [Solibacterales bacterium]|nr:hypothetical protein [Bryobacterales bacterium]|tara:strand:+ start:508 stop:1392 length:885 start_codon:yes stop_codon:yes gene_type:complete